MLALELADFFLAGDWPSGGTQVTILSARFNTIPRREQYYRISGNNGYIMVLGLNSIVEASIEPVATNPPTVLVSGSTLTFASSGPFTNVGLKVVGN